MRRLLDDLLVLTRIQESRSGAEVIEARVIVSEVLARFEERIREKGAVVRVEDPLPRLCVDRTWAAAALANLVSNALKFTRPGQAPEVEIASYGGPEGMGWVVRDRGPGVDPGDEERIFRLFERNVGSAWVRSRTGGGSEFFIAFGMESILKGKV